MEQRYHKHKLPRLDGGLVAYLLKKPARLNFPVVLVGKDYWQGLIDWFKNTLLPERMINKEDFEIFHVVDTAEEAVQIIKDFYDRFNIKPNLDL